MHLDRLGKADRLVCQALVLDLLRVPLAQLVLFSSKMTRAGAPIVRILARDPKWLEQGFQLQKPLVFTASKDGRQDLSQGKQAIVHTAEC